MVLNFRKCHYIFRYQLYILERKSILFIKEKGEFVDKVVDDHLNEVRIYYYIILKCKFRGGNIWG